MRLPKIRIPWIRRVKVSPELQPSLPLFFREGCVNAPSGSTSPETRIVPTHAKQEREKNRGNWWDK